MSWRFLLLPAAIVCLGLAACDQSNASGAQGELQDRRGAAAAADERERAAADLRILFIGNSHTSSHRLPQMIEAMLEKHGTHRNVFVAMNTDAFLADHAENQRTLDMLANGPWDIVVLQAQKYSQSGRYTYPHDGAIKLTKLAQDGGAKVLMYPEWGQKGNDDEGERIHALHEQIAAETGATVVPVGRAWDRTLREKPELVLHASDGNHATATGAYLTACVFACWLTESDLSKVGTAGAPRTVDAETRKFLQQTAWETVQANLPVQSTIDANTGDG